MTAAEIVRIATTVGTIQLLCDLLANWRIFSKEPYQRAVESFGRAEWKHNKAKQDAAAKQEPAAVTNNSNNTSKKSSKTDKHAKRLQRAEDDFHEAASQVARRHTGPTVIISLVFVILLRILGTEHKGNIIGVLPFVPFTFLQRVTARSLEFAAGDATFESVSDKVTDPGQALAFVIIYMLCTLSVKFYINKIIGTHPPPGADRGIMTVMDSPNGQKLLKVAGIDPEELQSLRA